MTLKISKAKSNSPAKGASNKAPFTIEPQKHNSYFGTVKVKRGRLTNERTGTFVEFLYNPTEVSEDMGLNLSEDALPGASDPLLHFASGRLRPINFRLELCGESSLRFRGVNLTNAAFNDIIPADGTYCIAGEVEFFQSFTFPTNPKYPGSDGGCDKAILTLGRHFNGVVGVLSDVKTKFTEFDPDLNPTRATVELTLKPTAIETTFADKWFTQTYAGYVP